MARFFSLRITIAPPSKAIDALTLSAEIEALGLTNFKGVSVLSRDVDAQGAPVRDQSGKQLNVPRFLLIHADLLSVPEAQSIRTILQNHTPPAPATNATIDKVADQNTRDALNEIGRFIGLVS